MLGYGGLVSAYVVVALVLLGLCLYTRWSVRVKLAMVVVVSATYVVVYFALPQLFGWPSNSAVPRKFNLIAVYIQEPDKTTGTFGDVFFWASDLRPGADARPRAYRLPFTPEFKAVFEEAEGKLRQNIPQVGESELDEDVHGTPTDRSRIGQKSAKITLRDAPPGGPPSKETPGSR